MRRGMQRAGGDVMAFQPLARMPDCRNGVTGPAYWICFRGDSVVMKEDGSLPFVEDGAAFLSRLERPVFPCGSLDGIPCYAVDLGEAAPGEAPGDRTAPLLDSLPDEGAPVFLSLRQSLTLTGDGPVWQALGTARHLVEWRRTSRFCGVCGTPLEMNPDEQVFACRACGYQAWPRVTPAVIVAVRDGDRLLLGHNAGFPDGLYAPFAGFVEPGESLEEACSREVREESAVEIGELRYFSSQHWPFPGSLMIAFTAEYRGGEARADGVELTDVRWFTRDDPPPAIPRNGGMGRALYDWFSLGGSVPNG